MRYVTGVTNRHAHASLLRCSMPPASRGSGFIYSIRLQDGLGTGEVPLQEFVYRTNRISERAMNRMINENAILSPTVSAGDAVETDLAALARFSAAARHSVRKYLKQAAIERELALLDTRMLDDLGLARGEIRAVARQAVSLPGEGTLVAEFSRML